MRNTKSNSGSCHNKARAGLVKHHESFGIDVWVITKKFFVNKKGSNNCLQVCQAKILEFTLIILGSLTLNYEKNPPYFYRWDIYLPGPPIFVPATYVDSGFSRAGVMEYQMCRCCRKVRAIAENIRT